MGAEEACLQWLIQQILCMTEPMLGLGPKLQYYGRTSTIVQFGYGPLHLIL